MPRESHRGLRRDVALLRGVKVICALCEPPGGISPNSQVKRRPLAAALGSAMPNSTPAGNCTSTTTNLATASLTLPHRELAGSFLID